MAEVCFLCSCLIFRASIARRYKSKVLEASSCCCSREGSCDLIFFLIFFFFFFFMPCAGWRNKKCQAPYLSKDAFVTKPAERTAAGRFAVFHHFQAFSCVKMLRCLSSSPSDSFDLALHSAGLQAKLMEVAGTSGPAFCHVARPGNLPVGRS